MTAAYACWCAFRRKAFWLSGSIAKLVGIFHISGQPNKGCLSGGLSRVTGDCQARFLGGLGLATASGYPVRKTWRYEYNRKVTN